MSTFQIRLIAIITMVIDHIGLFFFPQIFIFRIIGRISFPLFAWLIVNGAEHTRNSERYLKRLFILACFSQFPFIIPNILIGAPYWYLNVVFTLSLGLAAILIIKKIKNIFWQIIVVLILAVLAHLLNADYGAVGILSIACFYFFAHSPRRLALAQVVVFSLPPIGQAFMSFYQSGSIHFSLYDFKALFGVAVALLCIYFYNGKEGFKDKYLFYFFYPLQYIAILILQLALLT